MWFRKTTDFVQPYGEIFFKRSPKEKYRPSLTIHISLSESHTHNSDIS